MKKIKGEQPVPILTPVQQQEEDKLKKQAEAVSQITKLLEDNGLALIVEHLVRVVPKR